MTVTIEGGGEFTIAPDALQPAAAGAPAAPAGPGPAPAPAGPDPQPPSRQPGAGNGKRQSFSRVTWIRVPLAEDQIVTDMRTLLLAAWLTLFGIGAELGLLTSLGGQLSAGSALAHRVIIAFIAAAAVLLLACEVTSTVALATSQQESALAPGLKSSGTL